ncbi:MAG: N-acetylmuramoyl-L-alanine amidase, partial [Anaerotignaceae bacterium]
CSSNSANDNRAITIEVASDTTHPYAVTDTAYNALVSLIADICKRNGIKQLLWKGDKSLIGQVDKQNMTVHCWFANKACPGEYLYNRHGQIATAVNSRLSTQPQTTPYLVKVSIKDLNIRTGAGTNYAKTGKYTGVGTFTIIEEKAGQGSATGWGKLKSGTGWISLDYVTKL